MSRRILTIGAIAAVLIATAIVNLSLLDIITMSELRETLGRSLSVVAVSTLAIVLVAAIFRIGRRSADREREAES